MFFPVSTEAHDGRVRMGSLGLVLVCLLVHILVATSADSRALVLRLSLVSGDVRLQSFLTHQFLHADWIHLLSNLWFFYIVGVTMEKYWGLGKFLGIYLGSGVAGALAFLLLAGPKTEGIPMMGASGAISGMMGAFAVTHGDAKVKLVWSVWMRFGSFSIPAVWYLGLWLAGQVVDATLHAGQGSGVAYTAHIGGFLAGLLAGKAVPGDSFYRKAYEPDYDGDKVDLLVDRGRLEPPRAPGPSRIEPDGAAVLRSLDAGAAAARDGDAATAGARFVEAMDKAFTLPDLPAATLEACLTRLLESLDRLDLPPGALYAWARRAEQKDWREWALRLYDAGAMDHSPGSGAHARDSSRLRAAALRMDLGRDREQARLGLETVLRADPGGPLGQEAAARLAVLARRP